MEMESRQFILFFDGECNFCNYWVNWILRHDRERKFRFASLQSNYANQVLTHPEELESIVLMEGSRIFLRSTAILRICKHLSFPWKLAYSLIVLPVSFQDRVYNWFAHHRHQFCPKKEQCIIPSQETRGRFLD